MSVVKDNGLVNVWLEKDLCVGLLREELRRGTSVAHRGTHGQRRRRQTKLVCGIS